MELTHRFTVPTHLDETWAHFNDIASVAQCFPGATVSAADATSFSGSVKVKLGPIALVYQGSGTFLEKDPEAHRLRVEAKGKDKRGNGTAAATITLTMTPARTPAPSAAGGPATDVEVLTDLAITGKPAQFGRGVMQDVSDKLLGQFVACLEQRLGGGAGAAGAPEHAPHDATQPPGAAQEQDRAAVQAEVERDTAPAAATGPATATGSGAPPRTARGAAAPPGDAAQPLDLGAAVLPVLARSYWRQALGGFASVVVLWRWRRHRRHRAAMPGGVPGRAAGHRARDVPSTPTSRRTT